MAQKHRKKQQKRSSKSEGGTSRRSTRSFPDFFYRVPLHVGFILLLSLLLYGNTLRHDYTQDDALVIYDNMYTTQGLAGVPGILKYDTFKGFFKVEGKDKLVSGGRYRPLTLVWFALQWELFKRPKKDERGQIVRDLDGNTVYEGNTFIYHFGNVFFYGLTGIVLFLLLLRLFRSGSEDRAFFIAFVATLLFMVHPIHTEAVANIKGLDEIMTLLGSLATVYLALRSYQDEKASLLIAAAGIFFLSLFSKENAITFVAIIPLVFYFFTPAKPATIARYGLPFLGVAIAFLFVRAGVLGWDFGAPSRELMNNPFLKLEGGQWVFLSFGEKMAIVFFTLGKYLQLLFFPRTLTHDYYPRQIDLMGWGDWEVLLSLVVYLALGLYALRGLLKKDPLSFGILYYLLTLSIVSNIVFPVGTNMSERFLFMPSVGFCLVVALLAYRFWQGEKVGQSGPYATLVLGSVVIAAGLLALKTVDRNRAWKDNFTLFTNDVQYSPNSAKLRNSAGAVLSIRSQSEKDASKKKAMLEEALVHLNEAVRIHPTYENAFLQLGNTYNYLQQYPQAIEYYDRVLQLDPNDVNGTNNKGIALRDAKRFAEAIAHFQQLYALGSPKKEVDLKLAYTYEEAGKHYSGLGQQDRAIGYFQQAMPLSSDRDKLTYFIGVAHSLKKDFPQAIASLEKALSMTEKEENKVNIYRALASVHREAGNPAKAAEYTRRLGGQ
ncbi:MAG: tetratricopeptide repeat protein [Bacteroidota bacterium]